jgi:predicted ATP-binding protein involved in virulence
MRIERLEVKNFRCLEHITINFPAKSNIAVIVGINGAGKTTILDGLKIVLSSIVDQLIQLEIKKDVVLQDIIGSSTIIEQDEIHYTAESSQLDAVIKENDEHTITVLCTAKILEEDNSESTTSNITGVNYIEQYSQDSYQNFPLFVYYHDRPIDYYHNKHRKQIKQYTKPLKIYFDKQQLNIYRGCMQADLDDFYEFTQWFERKENFEKERRISENPNYRISSLEAVRKTFEKLLSNLTSIPFSDLRIVSNSRDRVFPFRRRIPNPTLVISKDNQDFKLDQLSSGEKRLLMLATDLARRLAIANPGLGENAWQGEGIVLIDEIDLHLHPQWQRRVLPALTKTFPNCQFIVTTHSPQVLSEVPRESVFILEDGKLLEYSPHTRGRDSNSILYEIFNVKERPEWSQQEIDHCLDLIDNEKWDEAREALKELSNRLGENDTAVVQAQSILHFMED